MNELTLFAFGLLFGSFINALVWRLHKLETSKYGKVAKKYSIWQGRSMCPHCKHELAARDLVPVLSWLQLRGKCRYCRKPISVQYPLVELMTGLVFAVVYAAWPYGLDAVGWTRLAFMLLFIVFFLTLAVYDAKWFMLPDRLVFPLIALSAVQVAVVGTQTHNWANVWQPVAGAVIIFALFWGLYQFSQGEWIGGGDVKLAIALGLIAGTPLRALLVVFFASILGTVASLPLLFRQKKAGLAQHIPFGPYLLAGCFLVVLFAGRIVDWYQRILL